MEDYGIFSDTKIKKEREKKKNIYIYIYTHIKFTEFKMVKDLPPSSPVPAEEFAWP